MQYRPYHTGFTLIEIMIVVALIGVLAVIAVPSYQDYLRKSRRADAQSTMKAIQLAEERYRANNPAYASSNTSLGIANPDTQYYDFVVVATSFSYSISATALNSQAKDSQCSPMTINQNNSTTAPSADCWRN